MTNGEKIKEIFPAIELYEKSHDALKIKFNSIWWNAKYNETTTKNNLVVDCISRQDVLSEIIRFSTEEGSSVECQQLYCDVNNMPSVTPQEPRWIPVSERLPDTDDEFLCWYEYYHWSQGKVLPEYGLGRYLRVTSSWSGEVASGRDVRVIAWMPLPKPYEPQESEVEE